MVTPWVVVSGWGCGRVSAAQEVALERQHGLGSALPGWSSPVLDGESQLSQHRDGAGLPALEIAGAKALARGELIRCAQDCFRRVTAFVPDQVIGRGRAETMRREELLGLQPVVLLYRAQYVITGDAVPRHMGHRVLLGSVIACICGTAVDGACPARRVVGPARGQSGVVSCVRP